MRIIAGKHKGRRIDCPEGNAIRPTSDMLRGAVFNILNFAVDWENANILDGCCGTGAFGIEALSRGAKFVTFVDSNRDSIEVTKHNLSKLNEDGHYEFMSHAIENLPEARRQYNVLYIDPPYSSGLVPKALKVLRNKNWIAKDAIIMAEIAERDKLAAPEGYVIKSERRYGNSKLIILSLNQAETTA